LFGRRTLKTVFAVMISLFLAQWLGLNPPFFAAIAAALSIQPTSKRSLEYAREQIQANLVGVIVAITFAASFGTSIYSIALAILVVIGVNQYFKWEASIPLSLITVIFIMESPAENFFLYAVNRFAITFLGIVVASAINAFVLPPKFVTHLRRQYNKALPEFIRYIAEWQNTGYFSPRGRKEMQKMISRTEQLEQWIKEQSKNEVQSRAYFRGLHMEYEKNEILFTFLEITDLYSKLQHMTAEDRMVLRQQLLAASQQVVSVLSNSPLPAFEELDANAFQEIYIQKGEGFNEVNADGD
jgi:uncharacterized membrane protein YgaE (UPF0421/DUF939 family)